MAALGPAWGLKWHLAALAVGCLVFMPLADGAPAAPVGLALLAGGFASGAGGRLALGPGRSSIRPAAQRRAALAAGSGSILLGALLGAVQAQWWQGLPALAPVSLPAAMGWVPALVLSIAVLASAAGFAILFEKAGRVRAAPSGTAAALAVAAGLALPAAGIWAGGMPAATVALDLAVPLAGLIALGGASVPWSAAGGLLLGYGALIGQGGLVGAHVAGVAQGSLHGWVWLAAALGGAWLGGVWMARLRKSPGTGPGDGADGGT
ncbi:YeeE/YedE thiosulfate transporter family protein [Arenibaculum sp.]|uniref:YeeE/YedE thiosulfate transporter family protein n=1 Tax=Arenibaculum sp. TaxID=2865862 RepID=UPI002E0D4F63